MNLLMMLSMVGLTILFEDYESILNFEFLFNPFQNDNV